MISSQTKSIESDRPRFANRESFCKPRLFFRDQWTSLIEASAFGSDEKTCAPNKEKPYEVKNQPSPRVENHVLHCLDGIQGTPPKIYGYQTLIGFIFKLETSRESKSQLRFEKCKTNLDFRGIIFTEIETIFPWV